MTTEVLSRHEIDVEDVEYLRHGDKPLLARIYRPRGEGPFPLIVDLHGGAWCKKDRTSDAGTDEPLARSGVTVVALDFRMPPADPGYPASLADVNYAIRWCKARAARLGTRPDMVGILGVSSGGHQAMLAAMRPRDARYAALALAGGAAFDASVRCAVLCWPVIDPLGRYEYAKQKLGGEHHKMAEEWVRCHDYYWGSEAAMAEGNPTRALERGEPVEMPPVLYIQGTADLAHPVPHRERFISAYRKAGGRVELELFEGMGEAFITNDPNTPAARSAIEKIIAFVHREIH
jgi:acetyl esterase/lipase